LNAEFVSRSRVHLSSGQHTGNYPSNAYLLIESRENVESAERRTGYLRYRENFISIAWASLRSHTERLYCLSATLITERSASRQIAARGKRSLQMLFIDLFRRTTQHHNEHRI